MKRYMSLFSILLVLFVSPTFSKDLRTGPGNDRKLYEIIDLEEFNSQGKRLTKLWVFVKPKRIDLQGMIKVKEQIRKAFSDRKFIRVNVYDTRKPMFLDPGEILEPDAPKRDPVVAYYVFDEAAKIEEMVIRLIEDGKTIYKEVVFSDSGYCVSQSGSITMP